MNKPNFKGSFKSMKTSMAKHSPEILTGFGIAGLITTTVLAVKVTPKAIELKQDAEIAKIDAQVKEGKGPDELVEKLTPVELVKATWKCYIWTAVSGTFSIACLIGAASENAKRNAALAAAYKLSETAFAEYKEKVIETIGEKKEKNVKDKVAASRVEKNPVNNTEVIITQKGNTLCYDAISGRYFKSDIDKINKAINKLNSRMISYDYVSLTEFYNELGLDPTNLSDLLGWRLDDGLIELDFSSQLTKDGEPCLAIDYDIAPRYDYNGFA